MSDLDTTDVVETVETTDVTPDVDLSAVPEKVREHVDKDKYSSDENYKRAADHGWTPLEVWKASGKDEADWVNYKAFNRTYDDMKYRKEMRDEMKATKKATEALMNTFEQEKTRAIQTALSEREAQLKTAIADGDAEAAVKLQAEIIQAKQRIPQPQQTTMHPVILDFVDNNPIMNPEAPEFNKEYADKVWDSAVAMGNQLKQQFGRDLSPFEVEACLSRTVKMTQKPEVKAKTVQKAPSVQSPSQKQVAAPKLTPTAKAIYNKLLAGKDGKLKAEAFLKNLSE